MSALLFVIELILPKSPRRQVQTWRAAIAGWSSHHWHRGWTCACYYERTNSSSAAGVFARVPVHENCVLFPEQWYITVESAPCWDVRNTNPCFSVRDSCTWSDISLITNENSLLSLICVNSLQIWLNFVWSISSQSKKFSLIASLNPKKALLKQFRLIFWI